jgi:hypothetical protein
MQAQEFAMAKWAISLRLPGSTDSDIQAAFDSGAILRTHLLRPTWHFVTPADIRWMLQLTAPRVRAAMAYMDRQLGVSGTLLKRSHAVFVRELSGGRQLTRTALQNLLRADKIKAEGPKMGHLLMHAELDGLICSGPRQGRQFTYALLDERAPAAPRLSSEALLSVLAHRYFSTRGPATVQDFSWWSGLTLKAARAGADSLDSSFSRDVFSGREYLFPVTTDAAALSRKATFLLPDYDEYGIAYQDRSALFPSLKAGDAEKPRPESAYNRALIVEGLIVGSWRPTISSTTLIIDAVLHRPINAVHERALRHAAQQYARFRDLELRLVLTTAAA